MGGRGSGCSIRRRWFGHSEVDRREGAGENESSAGFLGGEKKGKIRRGEDKKKGGGKGANSNYAKPGI